MHTHVISRLLRLPYFLSWGMSVMLPGAPSAIRYLVPQVSFFLRKSVNMGDASVCAQLFIYFRMNGEVLLKIDRSSIRQRRNDQHIINHHTPLPSSRDQFPIPVLFMPSPTLSILPRLHLHDTFHVTAPDHAQRGWATVE